MIIIKVLNIFFAGNLDLYITLGNGQIISENEKKILTFDISMQEEKIYDLFDKLYNNILNGNISNDYNWRKSYEYKKLVDENKNIIWISDDGPSDLEDIMMISKEEGIIKLKFIRKDRLMEFKIKNPMAISIRIRNARSKYKPFNALFMDLYNGLQHLDEYKELKKVQLKKV